MEETDRSFFEITSDISPETIEKLIIAHPDILRTTPSTRYLLRTVRIRSWAFWRKRYGVALDRVELSHIADSTDLVLQTFEARGQVCILNFERHPDGRVKMTQTRDFWEVLEHELYRKDSAVIMARIALSLVSKLVAKTYSPQH